MILGESGVGKELISQEIHRRSSRKDKPFIKINCATLPENLLESELFGYEKGAFTGAFRKKLGKFESANEGTIFLDEIGDIHPSLQAKLLHVLQDGDFSRLGGKDDIRVDVRILVATNQDLAKAVKNKQFREDLYYRLNVVRISIPPLRERKDEIPMFFDHFLELCNAKYGKKPIRPSKELMDLFESYHWPGNVRELENMIQRLVVLGDEASIIQDLRSLATMNLHLLEDDKKLKSTPHKPLSLKHASRKAAEEAERKAILHALTETNWHRKRAADLLNMSYKSLIYKIDRLGLKD
jgi:two-component system response regulator AtoC